MTSVLHPLRRDPEPVDVDVKEMNEPVAETVKNEYEYHLVLDVLLFHEFPDDMIAYGRDPTVEDTLRVGITSGVMAGGMKFLAQEAGLVQCFVAGTLVAAKPGLLPIEDIQPGDLVWATDPDTGDTALKTVVRAFRNESEELVHLTVSGEEIVTTPGHPFWVPQKGWTKAVHLRAGDRLQLLNGEYVVVEHVQHELLESPVFVYNFEVEDFHTYYVGNEPVLVHNTCQQKVAGTKDGYNAKVSVGGEPKHRPHVHINWKNIRLASVDINGNITDGTLDKAGREFVRNNLEAIAEGINKWWNYGR